MMDSAARDEMIVGALPMVRAIAGKLAAKLPAYITHDDLVDAGIQGLMEASRHFEGSRGIRFNTYARHRVRGAMGDELRNIDVLTRDRRRQKNRIDFLADRFRSEHGRNPTSEELRELYGATPERWAELRGQMDRVMLSASRRPEGIEAPETPDLQGHTPTPEQIAVHSEIRAMLAIGFGELNPRQQTLMRLYYWDGMTMLDIGRHLGINESRVSQIHKQVLKKLRQVMERHKISSASDLALAA